MERRARRIVVAAILAVLFLGGLATGAMAQNAAADEAWVEAGWSGGDIPNVSIVLKSMASTDPSIESTILPAIRALPGVDAAFIDVLPGGPPVVHVVADSPDRLDSITQAISALSDSLGIDGRLIVGGQLIADREVEGSIGRDVMLTVVPLVFIVGLVVAALHGALVGLGATVSIGLASLSGGLIGSTTSGTFDGTLGTTAVPGTLAGLLIGAALTFRLITWFKHPTSEDSADKFLHSVRAQLPDLFLVLGPLLIVALLVGLVLEGGRASLAVFMGAFFGAMATLATFPPFLSTQGPVPDNTEFAAVPIKIPDGRDIPAIVLGVIGLMLLGLGAYAAGSSLSDDLLDASSIETSDANAVSRELVRLGGDPSSSIRATGPVDDVSWPAAWAEAASRYPGVEWVATSVGRFEGGELVAPALDPSPLEPQTAIVNPVESARSDETQATVRALWEIDAPVGITLEGLPVDAAAATAGGPTTLWSLVAILAVLAGAVIFYLIGDLGLAVVSVALRLVSVAAALGAYSIVASEVTAVELQIVALVLSTGISLFEIGLIRMILDAEETLPNFVSTAMRSGGGHAVAALGVVALAGIGFLASGVSLLAAFGIGIAVAILIELLLGVWLLSPVILGEQTMRAAGPGIRGRSIMGRRGPIQGEPINPEWRRVVSGLLREEFRFQTEPGAADLGTVFVEGTPLFNELSQHNLRLRENGLRIRGEGPSVVSVKAVNNGDPVTVAITVDHPSRQLLTREGKLLGVRAAERRDGMLWLAQDPSGRYRISEAVDMGTGVPIPDTKPVESATTK